MIAAPKLCHRIFGHRSGKKCHPDSTTSNSEVDLFSKFKPDIVGCRSRTRLEAAHEQLQAEGYLQSFPGAGACIASSIAEPFIVRRMRLAGAGRPPARRRASRHAGQLLTLPEEHQVPVTGAFRVSLPALDRFPGGTWSRLVARHARHSSTEDTFYGDTMGPLELRAAAGLLPLREDC